MNYINNKRFKDAKKSFHLDTTEFDQIESGDPHLIDEYSVIGNFRKLLIFIPFYYWYVKRYNKYTYYRSMTKIIDEVTKHDDVKTLFLAYNIKARKKYGHFQFVSQWNIPLELREKDIQVSPAVHKKMILHHFNDNCQKIFADIMDSEIVDLLKINSVSNTSTLELEFEPIGMEESISLEQTSLVRMVQLVHAVYGTIILGGIVSLFSLFS